MIYTEKQVREALRRERNRYFSDLEMAKDIGVANSTISRIFKRNMKPSEKVCRFLGFKKITVYTGTGP